MWGAAKKLVLKSPDKKPAESDEHESQQNEDREKQEVESPRGTQASKSLFGLVTNFTKDKLKKKGHTSEDGTPRSPGDTPRSYDYDDEDEIQQLAVKDEDLAALRQSIEEILQREKNITSERKSYVINKPKPQEKSKKKVTKKMLVARPAPQDAHLKDVVPCGPRYTERGEIVPHSIVGSVQDFVDEALRRQEIRPDSPAVTRAPSDHRKLEVKQYERALSRPNEYIPTSMNQENALRNWRKKMAERKKIQGNISNLLEKPLDRLLMNQDDKVREIQETKTMLDRTIPAVDYGKGFRVGSEFWKQSESIGDDLTGIKMSVTKTERGSPVVFEHIGKPITTQHEVGETWQGDQHTQDPRRTWFSSKYLKRRMKQLNPIMMELDPHKPDIPNLEVVGNEDFDRIHFHNDNGEGDLRDEENTNDRILKNGADPLSKYPDVTCGPVMGPGLIFDGRPIYWTGPEVESEGKVVVESRITFECVAKQRGASHINIENIGTTAVYYGWRNIPHSLSFDVLKPNTVQRFYFNTGEGYVLPGDKIKIPFIFKSPNAGIFSETWQFITRPSLMSGAPVQIALRGVAQEDEHSTFEEREKIDKELRSKEALFDVQLIISELIRGIQCRERPSTPVDAYLTEEELFERKNPGKYYDHETILELKNIYLQLFGEDDREGREWDLSLDELQSCVTAVPDEEAQEELLIGLNKIIGRLSFHPLSPLQRLMYASGYKCWTNTIDKIVSCSMHTRSLMGLPEIIMKEPTAETEAAAAAAPPAQSAKADAKDDKKGKGKKGNAKDAKEEKGKKGKNAGKDAKDSRPKSKDPKGKGGKGAAQSPTKELPPPDRDESKTPSTAAPTDSLEPKIRKKYSEKMYSQVYELLVEMIENMTLGFEDAISSSTQS